MTSYIIDGTNPTLFDIGHQNFRLSGLFIVLENMPPSQSRQIEVGLSFALIQFNSIHRQVALVMCGWDLDGPATGLAKIKE